MSAPRGISGTPGAFLSPQELSPAPAWCVCLCVCGKGGRAAAAQEALLLPQLGLPAGLPLPALAPSSCSLQAEGEPGLGAQPAPKSSLP